MNISNGQLWKYSSFTENKNYSFNKDVILENITKEQIQEKLVEVQAEYDAQEYARNRFQEYNRLNQFELMTDDAANSTTTHADAIEAIKTKWPKDNSGPVE